MRFGIWFVFEVRTPHGQDAVYPGEFEHERGGAWALGAARARAAETNQSDPADHPWEMIQDEERQHWQLLDLSTQLMTLTTEIHVFAMGMRQLVEAIWGVKGMERRGT